MQRLGKARKERPTANAAWLPACSMLPFCGFCPLLCTSNTLLSSPSTDGTLVSSVCPQCGKWNWRLSHFPLLCATKQLPVEVRQSLSSAFPCASVLSLSVHPAKSQCDSVGKSQARDCTGGYVPAAHVGIASFLSHKER